MGRNEDGVRAEMDLGKVGWEIGVELDLGVQGTG